MVVSRMPPAAAAAAAAAPAAAVSSAMLKTQTDLYKMIKCRSSRRKLDKINHGAVAVPGQVCCCRTRSGRWRGSGQAHQTQQSTCSTADARRVVKLPATCCCCHNIFYFVLCGSGSLTVVSHDFESSTAKSSAAAHETIDVNRISFQSTEK